MLSGRKKDLQKHRQTDRHTSRQADRQKQTQTGRQTVKQKDRETDRDRQLYKQTGRQTDRTDRQARRQTENYESNNAQRFCSLSEFRFFSRFRWSRQRAVDFMAENTATSLHSVNTEIDRYIIWPGQVSTCLFFPLPL